MRIRSRGGRRRLLVFMLALGTVMSVGYFLPATAHAAGNAGYTTFDATQGGCLDSPNGINCNNYSDKGDVYMSGGPAGGNGLEEGCYYFAVLTPGSQNGGFIDGATGNLSDTTVGGTTGDIGTGDDVGNRAFSISDGLITYPDASCSPLSGGHNTGAQPNTGKLIVQLSPYDDTDNLGGVYILAICKQDATSPSQCKFDAFKIKGHVCVGDCGPGVADDLAVAKDANGAYTTTWTWGITKDVDKTLVKQIGGTATFNYTINVTHDSGTNSAVGVSGTITVTNPNANPVMIDGVTDHLSDGTNCTVTGGGAQSLTQGPHDFAYSCPLGSLPSGDVTNIATVGWSTQFLSPSGDLLVGNSASFETLPISFAQTKVDDCVTVTDSYAGPLGTVCQSDASPKTFNYSRTIQVPANNCQSYDNTATFTTNTTEATGSASQTVTVCGPARTGALTIGFWKTTNGQNLINTYCNNGGYNLGTYLKNLGAGSGPFSNAPTSCSALKTYVYNILNGASASNMNNMLKAQMLGTALDVWFSGPGWTSTKTGGVKPPSNFLAHNFLGTFNMDTTAICPMVDNLSTGSATCKSNTPSTNAVTAGAVPTSPMSIQALLDFAATTPSPFNGSTSSSNWYNSNKTLEEILKNIFDQFNNGDAFGSF